jgi:hypothetical protein
MCRRATGRSRRRGSRARGRREEVGASDVGADRESHCGASARADETEDHEDETERREGQAAECDVDRGHDRIQMRSRYRAEGEDDRDERDPRRRGVLEELQPTSCGLRRAALIPDPTTASTRRAAPIVSAAALLGRETLMLARSLAAVRAALGAAVLSLLHRGPPHIDGRRYHGRTYRYVSISPSWT